MKNLLLLFALTVCTIQSKAQLHVSPNAGADSYVYVNDQILFVEQGIQLAKNTTANEEPSIYLRNGSQLIQGATASVNSGNGSISVFQNTPNDDSWDYTYWSAPVGRPHWSLSGNRSFDANLISDSLTLKSSQTAAFTNSLNGIESPLTISRRWIYRHLQGQEEESSYERIGNSWNMLPAGLGYTMKGVGTTNHDQVYDFRGRPNSGDISVNVYLNEWTLSGNPYPSALDLNAFYHDADNSEIFQFWYYDEDRTVNSHYYSDKPFGYGTYVPGSSDPGGDIDGGLWAPATYTIWNANGDIVGPSAGSGDAGLKHRFAPIGQGFMIVGGATGSVVFKNAHRRYKKEGNESDFRTPLRIDGYNEINPNALPQIRINTNFVESHVRQILLAFSDHSSDRYDRGFDGISPMDAPSEIYFPVNITDAVVKPFVIQTLPFDLEKRIPVTIKVNQSQQNVELEVVSTVNFYEDVYLFDRVAQTYQEISNGHKSSTMLNPGNYEKRFYIVFQDPRDTSSTIKSLEEEAMITMKFFQNNPSKQLEVTNPEGYDIKQAQIFDMAGKLVYNGTNLGTETNLTFPTSQFSDGVYLVNLTTSNHGTITHKINVFNK